jgi:hypothetical protein
MAQFKVQSEPVDFADRLRTDQSQFGILGIDMSRFSMSHSYSMSYMSMGRQGVTQGLYLNTMSYQFSIPLTVSLQLGMAHNPFGGVGDNGTASILQNGMFVSGAQLKYKPTENTTIQFGFQNMPYSNSYPGTYRMSRPGSMIMFDDLE